jgi:hypothetical protein
MDMLENNFSEYSRISCPIYNFDGNCLQANKSLHQYQQVHNQENAVNPCCRGVGASGSSIVKTIAILFLSKSAIPLFINFNLALKVMTFVLRIPVKFVDVRQSATC